MAIKVECNICGIFIKEAVGDEIQKLTGAEVCKGCNTRVKRRMAEFDSLYKKTFSDIEKLHKEAEGYYKDLEKYKTKYINDLNSLHTTTRAELNSKIKNILDGDK